jgi:hypothetical protein
MLTQKNKSLLVPVEISIFIYDNKLIKPFAIFLYLKLFAADKVHAYDEVFTRVRKDLKMSDGQNRTFRKHFKKLLDLNWVGYNPKANIYHIRSFDFIRAKNVFNGRRATELILDDVLQLQVYLAGVIICLSILKQIYFWRVVKGRLGTAAKKGAANQSRASRHPHAPSYFGVSNYTIARRLGCKSTRACQLKQAAAIAGYITRRHRYEDVKELDKADYLLRHMHAETKPGEAKRIRFWRPFDKKHQKIKVVMQLHDEIIPHIKFKIVKGFAELKVPSGLLKRHLASHNRASSRSFSSRGMKPRF